MSINSNSISDGSERSQVSKNEEEPQINEKDDATKQISTNDARNKILAFKQGKNRNTVQIG